MEFMKIGAVPGLQVYQEAQTGWGQRRRTEKCLENKRATKSSFHEGMELTQMPLTVNTTRMAYQGSVTGMVGGAEPFREPSHP